MMNDQGVVAASPSSVRRVLLEAGRIRTRDVHKSKKGNGFEQPIRPHQEWHTDISFIKIGGIFYSNCSFLDGFSRVVVHSELRETMTEQEVEIVLQRAREKYPGVKPKIISDNGPQFISKDFKAFISFCQMMHVPTSPYYPQSNGKKEVAGHHPFVLGRMRKANYFRPTKSSLAERPVSPFQGELYSLLLYDLIGLGQIDARLVRCSSGQSGSQILDDYRDHRTHSTLSNKDLQATTNFLQIIAQVSLTGIVPISIEINCADSKSCSSFGFWIQRIDLRSDSISLKIRWFPAHHIRISNRRF
jgi:transposase InsO family protein